MNETNLRYFIITSGRSGSLLASILADAGANFGLSTRSDWSRDSGEMEHPDVAYVSRQFRRAAYLQPRKRESILAKYLIDIRRHLGKKTCKENSSKCTIC